MDIQLPSGAKARLDEPDAGKYLDLTEKQAVVGAKAGKSNLLRQGTDRLTVESIQDMTEDDARLLVRSTRELTVATLLAYLAKYDDQEGPFTEDWLMRLPVRDYNALAAAANEFSKELANPKG